MVYPFEGIASYGLGRPLPGFLPRCLVGTTWLYSLCITCAGWPITNLISVARRFIAPPRTESDEELLVALEEMGIEEKALI
jgi:hypothetical protein